MTKCPAGYLIICFVSGTTPDRVLASSIAALLCVQLGAGSESQVVFKTIKPHLITVIQDKTAASAARSSVSIAANNQICFYLQIFNITQTKFKSHLLIVVNIIL